MTFHDICDALRENGTNGFGRYDDSIVCSTYQRALHLVDFLNALGIVCHAKQLPMSHRALVIEGEDPAAVKKMPNRKAKHHEHHADRTISKAGS